MITVSFKLQVSSVKTELQFLQTTVKSLCLRHSDALGNIALIIYRELLSFTGTKARTERHNTKSAKSLLTSRDKPKLTNQASLQRNLRFDQLLVRLTRLSSFKKAVNNSKAYLSQLLSNNKSFMLFTGKFIISTTLSYPLRSQL